MNKPEALQAIVDYEREFSQKGVVESLDSFRKYNDAKYWMSLNGLKKETNGTPNQSNPRRSN